MVLYLAMQVFFSPSPRGSDQYWYVGDVERVVIGDGQFVTNSLFPESITESGALARPWVQNKPVSYMVSALTFLTRNGHFAWLLFNNICLFLSGLMIARILALYGKLKLYFLTAFLFFPLNFYLAGQALPEVFMMLLITAIHYVLLVKPINLTKIILLAAITTILICQRPNYILLIPLIPIFLFFYQKTWKNISAFLLFSIVGLLCTGLFASHLVYTPSILDTIVNNVQGESNMGSFFSRPDNSNLGLSELISILIQKFTGFLKIQFGFAGFSTLMFYLINVMIISVPFAIYQKGARDKKVMVCLAFIAIHFATVILFYNQYRYAASIVPSLFILCVVCLSGIMDSRVLSRKLLAPCIMGLIVTSVVIGLQVRKQSNEDCDKILATRYLLRNQNGTAIMTSWSSGAGLLIGYSASPREVFFCDPKMPVENFMAFAKRLDTDVAVLATNEELYRQVKPYIIKQKLLKNSNFAFFKFRNNIK